MPKIYKKKRVASRAVAPFKRRTSALGWHTNAIARPRFPHVGLGTSTTTVLRTSLFYNATADNTGVYKGYLAPGSCFDPTGDLSTIQPQMFDQFAAVYSRYKVNNAIVSIKITGGLGANSYSWVAAAYPAVDSTGLATYQGAACQQYAKTISGTFAESNPAAGRIGTGTMAVKFPTFYMNHNAVVGAKSDTWDIGALVTQSPLAGQFMVLPMFIQSNGAGLSTWILEIDIWQNVTFSQKKNVVDA